MITDEVFLDKLDFLLVKDRRHFLRKINFQIWFSFAQKDQGARNIFRERTMLFCLSLKILLGA